MISPIVAAALYVKPRGTLTSAQEANVDALKSEWPDFASMRGLAMRFRGILRSKYAGKLGVWLRDAQHSGLYAMQRFACTLRRDIDAVRNAITEQWSNGQTERQINRLITPKRPMYGRPGPKLLRGYVAYVGNSATKLRGTHLMAFLARSLIFSCQDGSRQPYISMVAA